MHSAPWREPTRALELRWGGYRLRYAASVALLFVGGLLIQLGSTYTLYFLVLGVLAHAAGWTIAPGRGGRRLIVAIPSLIAVSAPLIGSLGTALLVICLASWLWLRERPPITYLSCLLPVATGALMARLYPQYGDGGIVVGCCLVTLVGAAWIARALAPASDRRRTSSRRGSPAR